MRHLAVGILTGSPMIGAGLTAILARLRDPAVSVKVLQSVGEVDGTPLSVLFAEPVMLTPEALENLRTRMRVVALYVSALPEAVVRGYDDTLSLYAHPARIEQLVREVSADTSDADMRQELSPREKDVVVGIVKGLSNKEIAAAINVSVNTVMTHRRNIAQKLQIHSPAGLTIYAIVKKLVRLEDIRSTIE